MKIRRWIVCSFVSVALCCSCVLPRADAAAVSFPGPKPGSPKAVVAGKTMTLENNVIAVSWKLENGALLLASIKNKLTGKVFAGKPSPAFLVTLKGSQSPISDWRVVKPPKAGKLIAVPKAVSEGKRFPGKALCAVFESPSTGVVVSWRGELREGAAYIRSYVKLSAPKKAMRMSSLKLFDNVDLAAPAMAPTSKGSLVFDRAAGIFCGVEVPFSTPNIEGKAFSDGFSCGLKIGDGVRRVFSGIIGVFPKGQLRRAVSHYIERARVRAYGHFLHYNSWFDFSRNVTEAGMLERIDIIHDELVKKRGVCIDAYVVDGGYDDWDKGFWVFNRKKFPHGFKTIGEKLRKIGSHFGVWISPAGGYGASGRSRKKRAAEIGIKSFDLSKPQYHDWFLKHVLQLVKEDQVVYFKWDNLGGGVSDHFMALMDIAARLRKEKADIFINTTVGTWQSPFWLRYTDCTWRAGGDMGFVGDGDLHEQWLTYRDAISYQALAKSAFLYPLNALMNHGIVFANGNSFAKKSFSGSHEMRNDARIYFAGGLALQELYLSPPLMKTPQWDAIAEAVKWARKHEDTLIDAHFIGGDPAKVPYGFASWRNGKGVLALRNPGKSDATYALDIGQAFELPKGAQGRYLLKAAYPDQRVKQLTVERGKTVSVKLRPFEVLVFNAEPR